MHISWIHIFVINTCRYFTMVLPNTKLFPAGFSYPALNMMKTFKDHRCAFPYWLLAFLWPTHYQQKRNKYSLAICNNKIYLCRKSGQWSTSTSFVGAKRILMRPARHVFSEHVFTLRAGTSLTGTYVRVNPGRVSTLCIQLLFSKDNALNI